MMKIMMRIRTRRLNSERDQNRQLGQSLVEMAVMMLVLLIIMGGVLDLGRMYFTYLALQNAAGEGAAYGAIYPEWIDSGDNSDPNNIEYRVRNESDAGLIDWTDTSVNVEVPSLSGYSPITVSVSYTYTVITPMIQVITGESVKLTAIDTQRIFLDNEE